MPKMLGNSLSPQEQKTSDPTWEIPTKIYVQTLKKIRGTRAKYKPYTLVPLY